jgi:hypothetical protein
MARTHIVKKAQKDQGRCMSPDCTHESREIVTGMSYKHFSIRSHKGGRGTKKVYHVDCHVPQSHRTTSAQLGMIYDAQEGATKALNSLGNDCSVDDFRAIAEEAAQGIREAGEMYVESADNMESGFGTSTYVSDEIREKGEGCEGWADDIESAVDDIEDFDEDDATREAEAEVEDNEYDEDTDDRETEIESLIEDKRQTWFDEAVSTIEDAINNQPF